MPESNHTHTFTGKQSLERSKFQPEDNNRLSEEAALSEELRELAILHPTYSRIELEESHAQLCRYFDLAWEVFVCLERDGKLESLNLTKDKFNHTVKPQNPSSIS